MKLISLNVRLALRWEDKEHKHQARPTMSLLFWEEAFRCWQADVLQRSANSG